MRYGDVRYWIRVRIKVRIRIRIRVRVTVRLGWGLVPRCLGRERIVSSASEYIQNHQYILQSLKAKTSLPLHTTQHTLYTTYYTLHTHDTLQLCPPTLHDFNHLDYVFDKNAKFSTTSYADSAKWLTRTMTIIGQRLLCITSVRQKLIQFEHITYLSATSLIEDNHRQFVHPPIRWSCNFANLSLGAN